MNCFFFFFHFKSLLFPPSLYEYVTKTMSKSMILVFNKIDLVSSHVVLAWKHYFEEKYQNIKVILFTSYPSYNLRVAPDRVGAVGGLRIIRRRGKMRMAKEGAYQIQQACKAFAGDAVDITSWENKIIKEIQGAQSDDALPTTNFTVTEPQPHDDTDFDMKERTRFQNGILTVGCVGFVKILKNNNFYFNI